MSKVRIQAAEVMSNFHGESNLTGMKVGRAKKFLVMGVGEVRLMGRWLDQHRLPYRIKDVRIIPDDDTADVEAYEFLLDSEQLETEAAQESAPEVLKRGKIKVTFCM